MSGNVSRAAIILLSVAACFFFYMYMKTKAELVDVLFTVSAETGEEGLLSDSPEQIHAEEKEQQVTFYICGEVSNPDVYTLKKGSRINDAILLAGGATENAALDMMTSLASEILDGQKIYVPNVDDDIDKINYMSENSSSTGSQAPRYEPKDPDVVVNINTADEKELMKIPGVGEVTAGQIYEYREENGDFQAVEDIMNISGIGEKTFESIKKNITVGD